MRDACSVGRAHRYTEPQVVFHYTHSHDALRDAIAAAHPNAPTTAPADAPDCCALPGSSNTNVCVPMSAAVLPPLK